MTGYVLLLFLTAPSSCLQHHYWSRERYRLLFVPCTFLFFTLRCFGRLLLLLFMAASISVLQTAMLRSWLLTALLLRRDACWKKYIPAKGCNKIRAHFYLFVEVLLLLPTTSVLKRREKYYFFFLGGCAAAVLH